MTTSVTVYQIHNSLKLHFTVKDYDFQHIGLNPKVFNALTLSKRNDRLKYESFFNKIRGMENPEDKMKWIFISYFVLKPNLWIGDINEEFDTAMSFYRQRMKYRANYYQTFTEEMGAIFGMLRVIGNISFGDLFQSVIVRDGGYVSKRVPRIIDAISKGTISPETAIILDMVYHYIEQADSALNKNVIWTSISMRLAKFRQFMNVTQDDMNRIKSYLNYKLNDLRGMS